MNMATQKSKIIYTLTDEAPLLATYSLLPIIKKFTAPAGVDIVATDISVASRVLAEFPEFLTDAQKVPNTLAELGKLTQNPDTNIIKLPNVSASQGQLIACVRELQSRGYKLPDYPEDAKTEEEKALKARFGKCIGSSVNPVLREGNSDRRAPKAVKEYARKHPHSMGEWSQASQTHVSHMHHGDFYHGEKSLTLEKARDVKMELVTASGKTIVLKPKVALKAGEIIDSMFMSKKALLEFYEKEIDDAFKTGVMFSLHVKATMMKVSHPIVFGHCVRIFYKDAFAKHAELFDKLGVNVNNGMSNLYDKIETLPASQKDEVLKDLHACHANRPELAMVDSAKGITNFHSPNDIIVDADDAFKTGVMFSLHVKATMMKVSHPIVFGHCVRIFYKDAFAKHAELFDKLGVNVNNGMSNLYDKIETLPASQKDEVLKDLHACHANRPELAMVDSAKGITNFHSPNDIIVDASMPAMIRIGGKMWGADGRPKDVKAVMPESTFARIYQEMIGFCKWHGNFDPKTMGTVPNVGLMAQQAEEYGSHDKTFDRPGNGRSAADANGRRGRYLAHVPGQGRTDPRLGQAGRDACAQLGHAGRVLARFLPSARE